MVREGAIRLVMVDGHLLFREGLRRLLAGESDFELAAEAAAYAEALSAVIREVPDVVLLEPGAESSQLLGLCAEVRRRALPSRVLVVTGFISHALYREAVRHGACGVVAKHLPAETLFAAIRRVHQGEFWFDGPPTAVPATSGHPGGADSQRARIASLTRREREVVEAVAKGLKNKQIAERLSVRDITVRHHLTSIFAKLNVRDRLSLVVYAFAHGLAAPPPPDDGRS